jgi:hypothetical protein
VEDIGDWKSLNLKLVGWCRPFSLPFHPALPLHISADKKYRIDPISNTRFLEDSKFNPNAKETEGGLWCNSPF